MKDIEWIVDAIDDELEDVEKYAKHAMKYKETDKLFSDTCLEIAKQELRHSEMLHAVAVSLITRYRAEHGEPPKDMQAVYDYTHKRYIDRVAKLKILVAQT